jgi:enoyl-CoA hydratase/carnithine racemase
MSTSHVQIALQDQVLRVTLCRPEKKNALTNAMYGALADAIERAEQDPDVRVVMIDAEGDAFTAGNDLGDFAAVAAGTMPRSEMRVQPRRCPS